MLKQEKDKILVLDTNILISNPDCLVDGTFSDALLCIPEVVLVELDKFMKEDSSRGYAAKAVVRHLNRFRKIGRLDHGIKLDASNSLQIVGMNGDSSLSLMDGWDPRDPDHMILKSAKRLAREYPSATVSLVTNDTSLAIRSESVDVSVIELATSEDIHYSGQRTVYVESEVIAEVFKDKNRQLPLGETFCLDENGLKAPVADLQINEFLIVRNVLMPEQFCLFRFDGHGLMPLTKDHYSLSEGGVRAQTIAQRFMLDSFIVPIKEERIVIVEGPAGTGKTLLALAAGIDQKNRGRFSKVFYTRANMEADATFGFLPGDLYEKMDWLLNPVYDNLPLLINRQIDFDTAETYEKFDVLSGLGITATALSHMRGRSLPDCFIIVDETQNLTRQQVKMILTRAGEGSVVVLIGDTSQIDTPHLNTFNNGLTHAFSALAGEPICYRLRLDSSDTRRSRIAQVAIDRL